MGNIKEAIKYYEKMLEYSPNHIQSCIELAEIHAQNENMKEAIRRIRRAYQQDKENPLVLFEYGKILMLAEEFENAMEKLNIATSIDDNFIFAHLCKAEVYIKTNKFSKAVEIMEQQKERFPESLDVLNFLGFGYIEIAEAEKSSEYYQRAFDNLTLFVEKTGGNLITLANLAYVKGKLGDKASFGADFYELVKKFVQKKNIILEYLDLALEKLDFEPDFGTLLKERINSYKAE